MGSLLRKDIFDLIAYAHKIGLLTRISTNGYLLTRSYVTRPKQAGLNQCGVSIDHSDEDAHDRTRKLPGSYERVMQGLGYLRECGIHRKIISCVSHEKIVSTSIGLPGIPQQTRLVGGTLSDLLETSLPPLVGGRGRGA